MKILVVSNYQLYLNLTASFVHNQAKAYAKLGNKVMVVIPLAMGKKAHNGKRILRPTRYEVDGVILQYLPFLSLSNLGDSGWNQKSLLFFAKYWLVLIIERFAPDIIHGHFLSNTAVLCSWIKKRIDVPCVFTTHGSDTSLLVENKEYTRLKEYADKADYIVAVSTALANKLKLCATNTPISVILNGFAIQNMHNNMTNLKYPFSLLQVGHLIEQKKFDITIKAVSKWHEIHSEVTLTIIGQGVKRDELEKMCKELGMLDSVHFLGQVPNAVVLQEMAKSQFFVMPSVREGFGIVYLEAMASGCITIGTKGEGIADFIIDGYNGFLVPPDDSDAIVDKLEFCRKNPEQAKRIAKQGQKDAMAMTWEKNAKQYIELFNSLRK